VLNAGSKPAILVGQGAGSAGEEVVAVAERLGAGTATSLLGKPYVDESLPFAAGVMGHLGTTASGALMGGCDTLLVVGSNDPWTEYYPAPGQAQAVQIDLDGRHLGNRYPVDVPLLGDAGETLRALLPLLQERTDRSWRTEVEDAVRSWRELAAERAATPADPVNPERAIAELSGRLPSDAQVAVDVGSVTYWYARQLRLPDGVPAHLSSTLASMGCSVPYGLAAKLAAPERPAVVLSGDGSMQMLGNAELVTVAHHWRGWADGSTPARRCPTSLRRLRGAVGAHRHPGRGPRRARPGLGPGAGRRPARRPGGAHRPRRAAAAAVPGGEAKLDSFRAGIGQEGPGSEGARRLLDTYAEQEGRLTRPR
jgi:pyruvate dehydrogenase (quinone)